MTKFLFITGTLQVLETEWEKVIQEIPFYDF